MSYGDAEFARDIEARTTQIAALRAAVTRDPDDAKSHGKLAELLYVVGEVEDAIAHRTLFLSLRGVVEKKPKKKSPPKPNNLTEPIYEELRRIARSDRPIFVGPWAGEVGFELLYWIPFLRRFVDDYGVDLERLHVVSRGGALCWYEGLATEDRYADLFEIFTPEEISEIARKRHAATGSDKAITITPWDYDVASRAFTMPDMEMLHPSLMYQLFAEYWRGSAPFSLYAGNVQFRQLTEPMSTLLPRLPENFTAVKFYSRDSFDMSSDNKDFVKRTISNLARNGPVVVLDTGVAAHGHEDYGADGSAVISLRSIMTPSNNLHLQSCVVARANSFVGTYGGFSYLPIYYSKPAVSFFSENRNHLIKHSQPAFLLSEQAGAPLSIVSVGDARRLMQ